MARPKIISDDAVYLRLQVEPSERDLIQMATGLTRASSMAAFARKAVVDAARQALTERGLGPDGQPARKGK